MLHERNLCFGSGIAGIVYFPGKFLFFAHLQSMGLIYGVRG